jgi:hypothetical protein
VLWPKNPDSWTRSSGKCWGIECYPNNLNMRDGFSLNTLWKHFVFALKEHMQAFTEYMVCAFIRSFVCGPCQNFDSCLPEACFQICTLWGLLSTLLPILAIGQCLFFPFYHLVHLSTHSVSINFILFPLLCFSPSHIPASVGFGFLMCHL